MGDAACLSSACERTSCREISRTFVEEFSIRPPALRTRAKAFFDIGNPSRPYFRACGAFDRCEATTCHRPPRLTYVSV
jgi:hypothetical protein